MRNKLIYYWMLLGLWLESRAVLYANVAGMCSSFKGELLNGIHAFGPGTGVPARNLQKSR